MPLTERSNSVQGGPEENDWGFGQLLPMFLILLNVSVALEAVFGNTLNPLPMADSLQKIKRKGRSIHCSHTLPSRSASISPQETSVQYDRSRINNSQQPEPGLTVKSEADQQDVKLREPLIGDKIESPSTVLKDESLPHSEEIKRITQRDVRGLRSDGLGN